MGNYWIDKYTERFFAVYSDNELIAVTVYKKGAREIKERLEKLEAEIENLQAQLELYQFLRDESQDERFYGNVLENAAEKSGPGRKL